MSHSIRHSFVCLFAVTLALGLQACTVEVRGTKKFPKQTGQERVVQQGYAPAPYGYNPGATMPNFTFIGYANGEAQKGGPRMRVELSDFYNPTGDGVYPAGGVFPEGAPKPKALVVDLSAVWCTPCKLESGTTLPNMHEEYGPKGGQLLLVLAESASGGDADYDDLDGWLSTYTLPFPAVVDPHRKLRAIVSRAGWPTNYLIDTRTMELVMTFAGVPWEPTERPDDPYCSSTNGRGDRDCICTGPSAENYDECMFWVKFAELTKS